MFDNFKSITIEGGYFETPTTLNLFKKSHLSIIYGRNGSGKTTIAKSIRQLVGKITPFFTMQEKNQTAKSLLLFLKYVNEEHLNCYLGMSKDGEEDKMSVIKSWEAEEANWIN